MRRIKPFWVVSVLLAVPILFVLIATFSEPDPGPMGISIPGDEDIVVSQIIDSGMDLIANARRLAKDGVYRRDAHAKTHGCMLADFRVNQIDLPYRQGLFTQPKIFKAWVRYSSGNEKLQSDWEADARGMAIKVLGVPGVKLLDGEENEQTQDFLMINHPVFFIPNVAEYANFTKLQGSSKEFGYFFQGAPWRWKLRDLRIGLGVLSSLPTKPLLGTQFYSMAAYRLGTGNYVKYSARPVACDSKGEIPSGWAPFHRNGLGDQLRDRVKSSSRSCFDLMVQLQVPGKNMPVENPTVEWREKDSPFVAVARIEIGKQDIAPLMSSQFCENLSFTPWHALPAHEPVGGLNRVRKAVYQNISRYRRCMNGVAFGEPLNDGTPKFPSKPCQANETVPVSTPSL